MPRYDQNLGPNNWAFEFFGLPRGLLDEPVHVNFLDQLCILDLIHLQGGNFRITITSLSEVKTNAIFLELEVDDVAMQ